VVALSLGSGGSEARAQASGCPNDDELADYNCPVGPSYLIPGLTDLNGWSDRAHYRNILTGDVDGDGIDEMVARGVGGIQVYRFDSSAGQWSQVKVNRILPDQAGWANRQYYDTVRLGDIDGDGRAELVARSGDGILVFKYMVKSPDEGGWNQITTSGPMKDSDCFSGQGENNYPGKGSVPCWNDDPAYYSTIQLAPLGPQKGPAGDKPTMQLIGRSGYGLEVYKWTGSGWSKVATNTFLGDRYLGHPVIGTNPPDDYTTPTDDRYYRNILVWDAKTVVARDSHGLQVFELDGGQFGPKFAASDGNAPFAEPQNASTYSTLQLLRGAGPKGGPAVSGPVVLGRGTGGLQLWNWTGTDWKNLITDGSAPPLTDNDGFNNRVYYRTIQAADVNGDGRDEVLVRASNGMLVVRLDAAGNGWGSFLSVNRPALANDPWSDPAYYSTIKTAKLGKSNARSLLARGRTGVRTWYFDTRPGRNRWTRHKRYGMPPFTGADLQAYNYLNRYVGLPDGGVRGLYTDFTNAPDTRIMAEKLKKLQDTCTVPQLPGYPPSQYATCSLPASGATDAVWTEVANQIMAELSYALIVNSYFTGPNGLTAIQTEAFQDDTDQYASISDDLKLAQAANVRADVNYLELFEGILDILAIIPEAGEAFEITGAALGIADSATEDTKKPTHFDYTVSQVQSDITNFHERAAAAITAQLHYVLGDYGLMSTVGRLRDSGHWKLDTAAAASAHRQGFARWVYQQFLPALWDDWTVDHCRIHWGCAQPGPMMRHWQDIGEDQDGYEEADFSGYLPRQKPCGEVHCEWQSLEQQTGWDDTIKTLKPQPIPATCSYDADTNTAGWTFGCPLGAVPPGKFRTISCDYSVSYPDTNDCWTQQPGDGVTSAAARGVGTNRGTVDLATATRLKGDLDLRRGKVTFGQFLHEGGGANELVIRPGGRKAAPKTLRVKRGAKRHRARFETPRGVTPRIRGTLSISVRKERVGRGRKRRIRLVRTLTTRTHIDRARIVRPRGCGGGGNTTSLNIHTVVRGRRGRPAQTLGLHPVQCLKGGRMRYRAPRSRARVAGSRAAVRGRAAVVPLRCLSVGRLPCKGTLTLTAGIGGRRVVVGRRGFAIRHQRRATVRVRLSARARRAVAANGGRLGTTAITRTSHPSGLLLGSRRAITLLAR
jgi:hypothetical protein